ncbi:MAG: FecR family protein [Mesorhizobium sp.]|uniref:FecR family protein n=1 Tax=Mesorhizobium sp. TaxID=1871066 RepID=UPI001AC875AC|nr:FecR family protein [Mesorhizobium sp.]MBN9219495.1 FecR family protein [Mesorhizobium sp.]
MLDEDFEALRREATALIVRITSGEATAEDAAALMKWRARSARHERAFQQSSRVWKNLGPALDAGRSRSGARLTRRSFLAAGGMAAGGAGVALGLSSLGFLPPIDALLSDFATGVGEQRTVGLPDGSTMTLDGGTTISLDYSPAKRHLILTSGAAVFDVVRDETRPFVVTAANGDTTATGTSFSVKHGVDDISVDCLRGHITVQCLADAELSGGEAIRYSLAGLGEKIMADADEAAAWRRGLLIFRDRPLAEVVADLNRHRRGKVVIAGSALRSRQVSGVFHLDRPEEILAQLEDTLQVRPIHLIGGIVLLR